MKSVKFIFLAVVFAFVGTIGFMTVFNNRKTSQLEARKLQVFVKPDVSSVVDGTFSKNTDAAFSDQLEFRDFFVKTYYKVTFQSYNGDVVTGSEKQLFSSEQKKPDYNKKDKELKNTAAKINKVADTLAKDGRKLVFVSIPRKDAIMTQFLPKGYTSSDEIYKHSMEVLTSYLNENVIVVDAYDLFKDANEKGELCYYSTDHHVNFTGGMLVYNEIIEIIKKDYPETQALGRDDYNINEVVIDGSFNRLIGHSVKSAPEELNLTLKNTDFEYTRKEDGKESNKKIWGSGNSYASAYMDNDNAETIVTTTKTNCLNILITGSSYTNLIEVLLIPNSHIMASVDYRYNESGKSLTDYADEIDAQYVIYIPAQSTDSHNAKKMTEHLGLNASTSK